MNTDGSARLDLPRLGQDASASKVICVHPCSSVVPVVVQREALERLKWRSRRGLLELDLVFERFWAGEGAGLDEKGAAALEKLLLLPDNDLLDLVMGKTQAPAGDLGEMIDKLRAA
jgi:antitoxin CptB